MLINCGHNSNKLLTPEIVNTKPGGELHSFDWLSDTSIGNIPDTYNWIQGISPSNRKPNVIHYTEGGPWFENYRDVIHADIWWKYYQRWVDSGEYEPIRETLDVDYGEYRG